MLSTDITTRFFQVGERYRYDWRVTLVSGEVLVVKVAPFTVDDSETSIIVDAKWQGLAFGEPSFVDRLLGKSLPLAEDSDVFLTVIRNGVWEAWEKAGVPFSG